MLGWKIAQCHCFLVELESPIISHVHIVNFLLEYGTKGLEQSESLTPLTQNHDPQFQGPSTFQLENLTHISEL